MSKIVPSQSVKRSGSAIADESGSGAKKRSRKPVVIPEDVWFEALKSLSCPKWSKMRLVSSQLNGMVGRNVSRLPMAIIDRVQMRLGQREKNESEMIVSDSPILPNQKLQWFKDHGISHYFLTNAIIGLDLEEKWSIDLEIQGNQTNFNASVLFKAEFSPNQNPFSWAAMAYFLKMIYDPSAFVEKLSMYALDKKLIDFLFPGDQKRCIRCASFKLNMPTFLTFTYHSDGETLCKSFSWLSQNVQADTIEIPLYLDYEDGEICDAVSSFLLGPSWISASQKVNLGRVNMIYHFFRALIKKFRTLVAAVSTFPIISLSGYRLVGTTYDDELKNMLSGKDHLEDSKDDKDCKTYTISNGANQMQVIFMKPQEYESSTRFDIRVTVQTGEQITV